MCDLKENLVVCVGSPLLDIIVRADENLLRTFDLKPNNMTAATAQHQELFKTATAKKHAVKIGGSVTNTVRVLQAILNFENSVVYLGAIGDDGEGAILKDALADESVKCLFKICQSVRTGKCAVLIDGANRSLCTDLGASKMYTKEDFDDSEVRRSFEEAKCVYVTVWPTLERAVLSNDDRHSF